MQITVFQHVPFEDAAAIGDWAESQGHSLKPVLWYAGESPPPPEEVQGLAVMGGPMNIYETDRYPWLKREREWLARYLPLGRPYLGVCLGAQLMADALGGRVEKNDEPEIGWFDVGKTEKARESLAADWPKQFLAFHWHGDRFFLPPGARKLAESEACPMQAMQWGEKALGLQFHLDYRADSIRTMLSECEDELVDRPWVQRSEEIGKELESRCASLHRLLFPLLEKLFTP